MHDRKHRSTLTERLVEVWRLYTSGHSDDARQLLAHAWSDGHDWMSGEQGSRVALRLMERLAPVTDDPDAWAALPDVLAVYRAGGVSGRSWTLERDTAESLARRNNLSSRFHAGTVAKADVLAYITGGGEDEIIPRTGRVAVLAAE